MELRQLRYFATVASELNFTRAAVKLRVAQPALSRQIKQLEDELGATLLERDKRSVRLTSRGASFLVEVRSLLAHADSALASARSGATRQLNVGYVWGLFHSSVPSAMQRLRASSPLLRLNLLDMTANEQARALTAGRLDFGFIGTAFEAEAAGLEKKRVGSCQFQIALPAEHRLARRRLLPVAALADELFLVISEDQFPGAWRVMQQACTRSGFTPRVLQVADRAQTLLGLVAAGCGVAILPETLRALPHEGLVFRQSKPAIEVDLYVAWRKRCEPSLVDQFLAATHE